MILNASRWEKLWLCDFEDIKETLDAQRAALEAWRDWCLDDRYGAGGPLFDKALELMAKALGEVTE